MRFDIIEWSHKLQRLEQFVFVLYMICRKVIGKLCYKISFIMSQNIKNFLCKKLIILLWANILRELNIVTFWTLKLMMIEVITIDDTCCPDNLRQFILLINRFASKIPRVLMRIIIVIIMIMVIIIMMIKIIIISNCYTGQNTKLREAVINVRPTKKKVNWNEKLT